MISNWSKNVVFDSTTRSICRQIYDIRFKLTVIDSLKGNSTEIPVGQGHLNFYNGFDCDAFISWPSSLHQDDHTIGALETISVDLAVPSKDYVFEVELKFGTSCTRVPKDFKLNATVAVVQSKVNFCKIHVDIC